jgi:uncharacterized protein YukE
MTYVNPIPTTYNSTTISVDTGQLAASLATINTAVTDIATNLSNINTTLNGLNLNWLGDASSQAQTYNDNWNNVVQMLYGAMDSNGNQTINDGALSVLVSGLDQAINNYNANEQAVTSLFNGFSSNANSNSNVNTNIYAPQSADDKASAPMSNATGIQEYLYHTTAVNEDF